MASEASYRLMRVAMGLTGVALAAAAPFLGFLLAVIAGGGHGSPFGHTPAEAICGAALLGIPALLLLLGLALIWASATGRRSAAAVIAFLIPVDAAIAATALWQANRPEPPVLYVPPDPKAVIPGTVMMAVPACTPEHLCTTAPPREPVRSEPIGSEAHQRFTRPARP